VGLRSFAALALVAVQTASTDLPRGQIIDSVACLANPGETYSLYLPSTYSADRQWPLLMGFHPAARGRAIVETYRAAAETYGYVVAASNTSRNGPWDVSLRAVQAMSADVGKRFSIDRKRFYMTGHSGGARVAMQVALSTNQIAGVIASSAGYPDATPRASVPFVVFGTAGTEDFNHLEMRLLDRALTSPHRLAVFEGGHTLPPADVALAAVEWLELQAMKSGARPIDAALVDRLWQKREHAIESVATRSGTLPLLQAAVEDFTGLRDVAPATARATALGKDKAVIEALAHQQRVDAEEARTIDRMRTLEAGLQEPSKRRESLGDLEGILTRLSRSANAPADSLERQSARRILRTVTMGAAERTQDKDYLQMLAKYRLGR
jgi:pimeloyl-ACP methyl ester carboxylesterase